jgi:hypothetical protein
MYLMVKFAKRPGSLGTGRYANEATPKPTLPLTHLLSGPAGADA